MIEFFKIDSRINVLAKMKRWTYKSLLSKLNTIIKGYGKIKVVLGYLLLAFWNIAVDWAESIIQDMLFKYIRQNIALRHFIQKVLEFNLTLPEPDEITVEMLLLVFL
jgi:hypothetical protein